MLDYKQSLHSSLRSAWIIIKLVIPIYILAEVLYYYNILSYISFLVEPLTSLLDLPKETALSIISGMFLNIYAAIAFAAPLELTPKQWTILAIFLGICHSLVVETAVMKKIGISNVYSISLRVIVGFVVAFIATFIPDKLFVDTISSVVVERKVYENLFDVLKNSFFDSIYLTFQIIVLISLIILFMDFIKSRDFIKKFEKNISRNFSIFVGMILGITYGAGILIKESKSGALSKKDIFIIGTFLMICHAIIEDTLLFVIFNANAYVIVLFRVTFAIIFTLLLLNLYKKI
ncbi:nucleoside recognition protein [Halarcobacter ebronensis]|uniref:Nucleoside recognition protein n=1 Tax=Halarcobacter ebronensis TaxID=1462615 RepID=A0A4Q0YHC5_9BACT|nr:nucleoside recognition protein [Halarcobacter ebronensis]